MSVVVAVVVAASAAAAAACNPRKAITVINHSPFLSRLSPFLYVRIPMLLHKNADYQRKDFNTSTAGSVTWSNEPVGSFLGGTQD